MIFKNRVTFKYSENQNTFKIASSNEAVFDWMEFYTNVDSSGFNDDARNVFLRMSNILFNCSGGGEIEEFIDDSKTYIYNHHFKRGVIECRYGVNSNKDDSKFYEFYLEKVILNEDKIIKMMFRMSKKFMSKGFVTDFIVIYGELFFMFLSLPSSKCNSEMDKYETYMLLKKNIRKFDAVFYGKP